MRNNPILKIYFAHSDVKSFILQLDERVQAKTERLIEYLASDGPVLSMPFSKKIASKLYELRVQGAPNVRLLYTFKDGSVWILHGFAKKRDDIPSSELERALARLRSLRS